MMRLKSKVGFAAIAIVVIIGIAFYAVANNSEALNTANSFEDVNNYDWFYGDVEYAVQNGLMNGTSDKTFAPGESTTRGMIVTVLWRAEGKPVSETDISFIDIEETAYYYGAVKWAAENEIVTGYDKQYFGADDAITREQIAAILYRYAGYKGYDTSIKTSLDKYADKDLISDYAVSAFEWATGCNIITGTSEVTLSPGGNAERCQVAAMLRRFIGRFSELSKPETENSLTPAGNGSYSGSSKKPSKGEVSGSDKPTSENVAKIIVGNKTAKAGEAVQIDVEVQNNPGILGMILCVEYNQELLTLESAENGDALKDILNLTLSKELQSGSKFVWDGLEINPEDVKDGTILSLRFKVSDTATPGKQDIKISCVDGDIIDNNLNTIPVLTESGYIEVE